MNALSRIIKIAKRECRILVKNPIYLFSMVFFPIIITLFFVSMMNNGQPTELPVGVVDLDNTPTSRKLIRTIDSFQTSKIAGNYPNMNEARKAIQKGDIYAFLLIPKGTAEDLMSDRQPNISFYYNGVFMVAGSTTFRDLKTAATLGAAGVGTAKLSAIGKTKQEILSFLQPITIDLHMINNPWANYNVYLSTVLIPGLFMLLIFLITVYSIGTELKFAQAHEWMYIANGNPWIAVIGKMIPQTIVHLTVLYGFSYYIYAILGFPHNGGILPILLSGLLTVVSSQCFGIFIFGLIPSLRMSMTVCSLWAMVSFSLAGSTYPVTAMDPFIEGASWLFPLRHYFMIYQTNIFNGYPMSYIWIHWTCLAALCILPVFVMRNIRKAMLSYKYIP